MSNKYSAIKTESDGITFDSRKEARRYNELKLLQRAGQIKDLQLQPVFLLQEGYKRAGKSIQAITYIGDFSYIENGRQVVEDAKGMKTEVYRIKKKLLLKRYPELDFREV